MSEENQHGQSAPEEPRAGAFEENLERLESIVARLEEGSLSLDEAMRLYEEGIKAYRTCREALDKAEARVIKLVETLDGELKEEPFEPGQQ